MNKVQRINCQSSLVGLITGPTSLPVYNLDIYLSEHRHFSITLRLRHTGRLCFAARTFHRRAVSPPRCHAIVTGGGETK
jgi:hypothetical protein